eukprot:CAMPEP_0184483798 /NCGR_PEP_ID=MMETSP0113_2-20130426/5470_1 /TAXON_ID=91329 /ORGANISM="Norrisiella sphaerica, Strain BC52" /LENGTH=125 /DNA_ID=CAMNT_0026864415 /DNA_START=189 /DNA_END=569 /DNA_ORIENTATION=-
MRLSVLSSSRLLSNTKDSTGIAGLPVIENAREVLIALYQKTLEDAEGLPKDAGYRDYVTKLSKYRLTVCEKNEVVEAIEKEIGTGEIEELIQEAEDELKVLEMMKEWKPWAGGGHWKVPEKFAPY